MLCSWTGGENHPAIVDDLKEGSFGYCTVESNLHGATACKGKGRLSDRYPSIEYRIELSKWRHVVVTAKRDRRTISVSLRVNVESRRVKNL